MNAELVLIVPLASLSEVSELVTAVGGLVVSFQSTDKAVPAPPPVPEVEAAPVRKRGGYKRHTNILKTLVDTLPTKSEMGAKSHPARPVDVPNLMATLGVTYGSVSSALLRLRKMGIAEMTVTSQGERLYGLAYDKRDNAYAELIRNGAKA